MESETHAQGWKRQFKHGDASFELILTTGGHIYYLTVAHSIGGAVASNVGRNFGLIGGLIGGAVAGALEHSAEKDGKEKAATMGLTERIAAAPKRSLRIEAADVAEFFAGEKGWGYGKKRNGIYFRQGVRKPSRLKGMYGLNLPEDDHAFNAAMKGWCEALKIRCAGFECLDIPDPVWLEGPNNGEVSQPAADAFAWMAENIGADLELPPASDPNAQTPGSDASNVPATASAVLGGLSLLTVVGGCCVGQAPLFVPVPFYTTVSIVGGIATCMTFLLAIAAVVLGIIGLTNTGKIGGAGKTPAIVGLALGVVSIIIYCMGWVLSGFIFQTLYPIFG